MDPRALHEMLARQPTSTLPPFTTMDAQKSLHLATRGASKVVCANFIDRISTRCTMRISQLIATACLSCALTTLFAQAPDDATLISNPVYEKNCAKCHGKSAEGRHFGGPSLVSEKTISASADDLRKIITNGKGHMPKYSGKISAEEIDRLVQQIKAGKPKQ